MEKQANMICSYINVIYTHTINITLLYIDLSKRALLWRNFCCVFSVVLVAFSPFSLPKYVFRRQAERIIAYVLEKKSLIYRKWRKKGPSGLRSEEHPFNLGRPWNRWNPCGPVMGITFWNRIWNVCKCLNILWKPQIYVQIWLFQFIWQVCINL